VSRWVDWVFWEGYFGGGGDCMWMVDGLSLGVWEGGGWRGEEGGRKGGGRGRERGCG